MTPPVVLFAFNRPDKLGRVLAALRIQDIGRLIVFVDGPRDDADVVLVERCRNIARDVDWVDAELHIGQHNRGLPGLTDNIDTVMSLYHSAVFVEDDCLPMPGFYSFMREALRRYESETKVFSIGGYQPVPAKHIRNGPYSVVSCARFLCWGWATWQDRWELIAPYLSRYWELFGGLANVPDVAGRDLARMARDCAEGRLETWDVQVAVSALWLNRVHLLPTRGLVRNIGLDTGTHQGNRHSARRKQNRNVDEHPFENVVWLENLEVNKHYAKELQRFVESGGSPIVSRIKNRLRQRPWLISAWRALRHTKARLFRSHPERLRDLDFRQDKSQSLTKSALLSYIVHPFLVSPDTPHFLQHINIWHAREMVRILNDLSYAVDVVDYRDTSFRPRRGYDLFIGHGGINFEGIVRQLPETTAVLYFATGCYWRFHNEQELARFAALRERRGAELPPDRLIKDSEEGALLAADGVIGIGNDFTKATYADAGFSPVTMVNGTSLACDYYERQDKDFEAGKDHFLYFAGYGPVHKGLDLLLEVFAGLEQHLWICTKIDQRFAEAYSAELRNCPNIHLVGWIQPRSSKFFELIDTCNYVILPSCSEGQAQSLVECMNHGLIPVVSHACGLDIDDYGVLIDPCTSEGIASVVRMVSSSSAALCQEMSAKARRAATCAFTQRAFSINVRTAIERIVAQRDTREECVSSAAGFDPAPLFIDEKRNVLAGRGARIELQSKSDERYFAERQGVTEVDTARWEEAQRYERRTWMEGGGLRTREDRNSAHEEAFDNYLAIRGRDFGRAIEIGCGPFTNITRILKHVHCAEVTLLDPLIEDYLTHPNCRYRHKRLGGWFGRKVETVSQPVEYFHTDRPYDLVVVINVLEHCLSAPRLFERIASLTAPAGVVVFHDKLLPASSVRCLVTSVYDAGHPLRVMEDLILGFLAENYVELYRKHVPIRSPIGEFDSIYFIGQKRESG